jgi:agmatine deiminase
VTTPRDEGYAMPPEWAPHARCLMAWPCREELWGERMPEARKAYAEVAQAIVQYEPVTMIARPDLTAEASLHCGQGISVRTLDHDDSWTRDTAPTFVIDGEGRIAGVDWRYDGYGGRAPLHELDAKLAEAICTRLEIPRFEAPVVLEGGAVHVDGEGTCLVCAGSAADPRRNPDLSRAEMEAVLREYLAVSKVIWLEGAFSGDETGGHVDNVACFVRPGVVLALTARNPDDANHPGLQDNLARLRGARDAAGRELEIIEVEQPAARLRDDGRRLTTSYLNFYVANGAVVLPMFSDPMDDAANDAIRKAFSDRQVVQIDAGDLVLGGGGIHCITQQQPASG